MPDIAELSIRIESQATEIAAQRLNGLTRSSSEAELAAKRLIADFREMRTQSGLGNTSLAQYEQSVRAARNGLLELARTTDLTTKGSRVLASNIAVMNGELARVAQRSQAAAAQMAQQIQAMDPFQRSIMHTVSTMRGYSEAATSATLATHAMAPAADLAGAGIGSFNRRLTGLGFGVASAVGGASGGGLRGLALGLIGFAPGSFIVLGAVAGFAAVASALDLMSTHADAASERIDRVLGASTQRFGGMDATQLRDALATIRAQRSALQRERDALITLGPFGRPRVSNSKEYARLGLELQRVAREAAAAEAALRRLGQRGDGRQRKAYDTERHRAAVEMFGRALQNQSRAQAEANAGLDRSLEASKAIAVEAERIRVAFANSADAVTNFKRALEESLGTAERLKRALEGDKGFTGAKGGSVSAGGGVVPSGLPGSGDILGIAAIGAFGEAGRMVAGVFGDLTRALFGAGDAAELVAIQHRRLQEAYLQTIRQQEAFLANDSLAAALAQLEAEFEVLRDQAVAAYGLGATKPGGVLDSLADLQARRKERIREEFDRRQQELREDLEVRRLRAAGQDDAADAMARAIEHQREYAQAVRDGADAATLATLAQVQMAERNREIAERAQQTIAGLQAFRDSLLLGPQSALSPFAQYNEARRQYEAVLAAAQGGDRGAAGRLPEIARAFLDASRNINASGRGYAADFGRVTSETEALIARFGDYAIEVEPEILYVNQQQLDVLKEQREAQQTANEHLTAAVAVLTAGFVELIAVTQAQGLTLDDQSASLRRLAGSAALN